MGFPEFRFDLTLEHFAGATLWQAIPEFNDSWYLETGQMPAAMGN
jgi:hypothetical protein